MKKLLLLVLIVCGTSAVFAQDNGASDLQKVYETEKAFEKTAAEKGVNQSFLEYTSPDAVCFFNGQVNCREYWKNRPPSPAALLWNPNFVDVSSNGVLAYTTGNSIFRPKGKDDPEGYYGQYVTVWQRQPDGRYLAVVDMGVSHEKPAVVETKWSSPPETGKELNEKKISAAYASAAFFEMAAKQDLPRAYKSYLAEDARFLREGKPPILGKKNALEEYKKFKSQIQFAKRSFFVGAADLAYVSDSYTISDRDGKATETGNFLQIWKLRGGKWQIVFDVFLAQNKK